VSISSGVARLHRSYAWGLDASGTLTGAGGVGGLLLTTHYATPGSGTRSNAEKNAASIKLTLAISSYLVATSNLDLRVDDADKVVLLGGSRFWSGYHELGGRRLGGFQPLGEGGRLESADPWGEGQVWVE
jgi:hypothetical protein